jgi:hypothetical protein
MGDIAEDSNQEHPSYKPSSRKCADSLHPRNPTPPRARRSDVEQQSQQALISAYLRSSYYDDEAERPRRFLVSRPLFFALISPPDQKVERELQRTDTH